MGYRIRYGKYTDYKYTTTINEKGEPLPMKNGIIDKLIIHHIAFNELYRTMLFDYCIPALLDDVMRLKKAGVTVEWVVHTDTGMQREYKGVNIKYQSFKETSHFYIHTFNMAQIAQIEGAYIAMISPDCIFGKGSLYNAYMLARYKDTSISIAHPRVLVANFMAKYPAGKTYTNRQLVKIAMNPKMQHRSLQYAFDDLDENFTNQGISIRRMGKGVYGVVHTLPSGVIFKFNQSDINYLQGTSWGEIDRGLNIKLFAEKRIKLVGSSDICFFIELTRPDTNFSFLYPNLLNNDKHADSRQNIFNNMIVIWTEDYAEDKNKLDN